MFETYMTIVGRVISEPNTRTIPSGDKVCSFRIVATERRLNRDTQEWADGDRLYMNVTCWRKLAENVTVSVLKGDHVMVNGRVYLNEYEVNGQARSSLEMDARAVGPNLSMCTAVLTRPNRDSAASSEAITPSAIAA